MGISPIDSLIIDNEREREKVASELDKNDESLKNLIQSYLGLARKNQDEDFKKRSNFLKIFPLFFAENASNFYEDREIQAIKKGLLYLNY